MIAESGRTSRHRSDDQKQFEEPYPEQCPEYGDMYPEQSVKNEIPSEDLHYEAEALVEPGEKADIPANDSFRGGNIELDAKQRFGEYENMYSEASDENGHYEATVLPEAGKQPVTRRSTPRRSSLKAGSEGETLYVVSPTSLLAEQMAARKGEPEIVDAHNSRRGGQTQKSPKSARGGRRRSSIGYDAPFKADHADEDPVALLRHDIQAQLGPFRGEETPSKHAQEEAQSLRLCHRRSSLGGFTSYRSLHHEVKKQQLELTVAQQTEVDDMMAQIRAFDDMLAGKNPITLTRCRRTATAA